MHEHDNTRKAVELTPEACQHIVNLQVAANAAVNPNWSRAGYPWTRAVCLEAAEAIDHMPWKWWKSGQMNDAIRARVRVELVDILHFGISHLLVQSGYDDTNLPTNLPEHEKLNADIVRADVAHAIYYGFRRYENARQVMDEKGAHSVISAFETIMRQSLQGIFSLDAFVHASATLHMDPVAVLGLYIGKNALNLHRQEHGYKTGEYIKDWSGDGDTGPVEDNDVMYNIAVGANSPQSVADFRVALGEQYRKVLARHGKSSGAEG